MSDDEYSCTSALVATAAAYWTRKRRGHRLPGRADLDPGEMVAFLPNVILLDVLRDPLDFRYRLVGTTVEDHMLRPYTGMRVRELDHQRPPSRVWTKFETAIAARRPVATRLPYVGPYREFVRVEDVVMPLAADGATVDMLFVVIDFIRTDELPEA